jgi:REP element-mobilizing transposase RayT
MRTEPLYHHQRNLPHFFSPNHAHFVTFCTWLKWELPERVRSRVLKHCIHDHGTKMQLHCAVVMPDHVHLLLSPLCDENSVPFGLSEILNGIKGASAHSVNRILGRRGRLWQSESFDRTLRREDSEQEKADYICMNPVRKGLAQCPDDYPWLWREWVEGEAHIHRKDAAASGTRPGRKWAE